MLDSHDTHSRARYDVNHHIRAYRDGHDLALVRTNTPN